MAESRTMQGNQFVGLFLIGISLAMFVLGILYRFTSNLNVSWIGFGIVYAGSLFGIFGNLKLKKKWNLECKTKIIKPASIIILALGLAVSFVVGVPFGDRLVLLCVLISVGLHFLPFGVKSSALLAGLIIANAVIGICLQPVPVWVFIFSDGLVKLVVGLWLFLKNRTG